ncbi:hypothetical protein M406DRAFT_38281 [Cryphonectria parasitica EP155]|uniref:HRDC domain-containing protein n=1 Tax=Cryphonectria parasitica (strain ATCC 38755 / EP155) TaxID=660469 RepID=A0A9P4Y4Y4_CRYP1|nr:uncharacterized protein M406DRAFT_38281 [Cryphonectria parasitica EP155]KAF3766570.1 hypothetical protein M406DRAFT_38281 [Cryphonectria parasitica EP155]
MISPPTEPELPSVGTQFWSHKLYRGPNDQTVRILYSRTKAESESIAQQFLGEKVVGFDMEWPWQSDSEKGTLPLQKRIGLIQIACEDKIALFHIGLHPGKTSTDILAPSLQKIIESPDITKTGVAILNADFSRLRKWFGLSPRGAFELSHLHNLVVYGPTEPQSVTTRMRRLSLQVELHLGSPLHKGKVRTSNWSRQLNPQQIEYAAADAYAGFMLFHCMNAKRTSMDPMPPLPLHADIYQQLGYGMGTTTPVQLGPHGQATAISSFQFFRTPVQAKPKSQQANRPSTQVEENKSDGTDHDGPPAAAAAVEVSEQFADTKALFEQLRMHRKDTAKERKCSAFIVASNVLLDAISRKCPRNTQELLQISGIGKRKAEDFGPAWLEITREFLKTRAPDFLAASEAPVPEASALGGTSPQDHKPLPTNTMQDIAGGATSAPPVLHTGLSFTLEDTTLADSAEVLNLVASQHEGSDDDSAFGSPIRSPSPSSLKRKREMVATSLSSTNRNMQNMPWGTQPGPTIRDSNTELVATAPRPTSRPTRPVERQIFRNKIVAFNKLVTPAVILSEETIDQIVENPPRTVEELLRIPGVMPFANVCARSKRSFLEFIIKATPDQVLSVA